MLLVLELSPEITTVLGGLAFVLLSVSQFIYLKDIVKGKLQPHLLSWIGWSLLMASSTVSQWIEIGWEFSLLGMVSSSLGCALIAITALLTKNYLLILKDMKFVLAGLTCLGLYFFFQDPWITTLFAILADFVLGWPTLVKAYRNPDSERSNAWNWSWFSWVISFSLSFTDGPIYRLFPLYLLLWCTVILYLTHFKKTNVKQKLNVNI